MATPPPGLRREDFQIAFICAVGCEYEAVAFALDHIWDGEEVQLGNAPEDYNKYTVGRIANHNIVVLLLPGMGKVDAASAANRLRLSYTGIKLAILVGICGGVPEIGTDKELLLGDVVISKSIVQYDLGKQQPSNFVIKGTIEDSLGRPHESVRSVTAVLETDRGREKLQQRTAEILQSIQEKAGDRKCRYTQPKPEADLLFEPQYLHRHPNHHPCECSEHTVCDVALGTSCRDLGCDLSRLVSRRRLTKRKYDGTIAHELQIVVGRLGSGDTVMKSGLDRDRIAKAQKPPLVAFEMEGAGVWDRFPCLIVKAVCDYADSHKNKDFQHFAAARAAAAARAILEGFPRIDDAAQRSAHRREPNENDMKLLELLATEHEKYKNFNPRKHDGTCEWFFKDQKYQKWLQSTASSIIWISAGPGCGKSVLTRSLIDGGRLSTNPTTVCYFFFKFDDVNRINSHDALSAILHQLFTQNRSLIHHSTEPYSNYGDKLRNNFHELWRILLECASDPAAGEIVCVLDALDECSHEGWEEILQMLQNFYFNNQVHASPSRLKFLITSRPYDFLEARFAEMASAEFYCRLDGDDKSEEIRQEINLFIDHKVNDFAKGFREQARRRISDALKDMKNCNYLYLRLILGIINGSRSAYSKPSDIEELLSCLPPSVFDAYETILARSQDEKKARHLLNIMLAATKPLTLGEVNYSLTLQAKSFGNIAEIEDDVWDHESFKSVVRNLCGLFITVIDHRVVFIHQTAQEFLTTPTQSKKWMGTFDMYSAHRTMFTSCIRMLSLDGLDIDVHTFPPGPNFWRYAAENWTIHFNSQDDDSRETLCKATRELCRTQSRQLPAWARYLQSYGFPPLPAPVADLTLASYFNLLEVVEYIINEENVDVNSEGGYFGTAIKAGAARGHLKLVKTLISHGADCDAGCGHFRTALLAAVVEVHPEVIDYLLSNGSKITEELVIASVSYSSFRKSITSLKETYGKEVEITADVVAAAAAKTDDGRDIVTFLLERYGNEFKITEGILASAATNNKHGLVIIAQLLNERREECIVTEKTLENAALNKEYGYFIIAKLLDNHRGNIVITDGVLENAFLNRVCGHLIIMLLLEKCGHRFSVTPKLIENAASGCTERPSETVAVLLNRLGKELKITPGTVMNAAQNAFCGVAILGLLLEKRGSEVEITQEVIMAAAENNSEAVMRYLLIYCPMSFELTEELSLAIVRNAQAGEEMMDMLVETFGDEVQITKEVIFAGKRNNTLGSPRVTSLLRKKYAGNAFQKYQ
ncbi:hypothetical protein GCG54_00005065 [Colletotrichum gloeosporioides]|uniref:Nucleoside phosphorylase domain-containing protein n=1 Tax=Colletotrichum gloeosporioides TaxID=474922 RepID=A0A8H4CKL8_COLGL|nr:uncharacterized protein GCG54_00005065 [Colletotrichum gloeosporioides]KAF3805703.1 hypothetical protein GCG54_00005065 [Colletotrichum gloeosporioides]